MFEPENGTFQEWLAPKPKKLPRKLKKRLQKQACRYPYNHHPRLSQRTKEALSTLVEVAYAAAKKGILPDESHWPERFNGRFA